MLKVINVAGARPNFMKVAPIVAAMKRRSGEFQSILVHTGQRVQRGDRIALVGNSGLATGPHLHYEVHVNGRAVDPLRYVMPESVVTD